MGGVENDPTISKPAKPAEWSFKAEAGARFASRRFRLYMLMVPRRWRMLSTRHALRAGRRVKDLVCLTR